MTLRNSFAGMQSTTPIAVSYRDLHVWQRATALAVEVYRRTAKFPADERFGLTSQVRRAVVSVASNIAEGSGRASWGDLLRHLSIARGSLKEVEAQLFIAVQLGYCTEPELAKCFEGCDIVSRMLTNLQRSIRVRREALDARPRTPNAELRTH